MSPSPVVIAHGHELLIDDVVRVARDGARVELDAATAAMLDARRAEVVEYVRATQAPAYGFNRGFGHNVKLEVKSDATEVLQRNLIRSHACGVGEAAPVEVVRAAMLLRARSLAEGHSGVRSVVVTTILDFLNAGIAPVVPRYGTVSASGDLAPLAHIALGLTGEGEVDVDGRRVNAAGALERAGIAPLVPEMKEGLALTNGSQYSAALGVLAARDMETLLDTACVATALTAQVMLAAETPFRADLHALRPHSGAQKVAAKIFALMTDSPLREAHRPHVIDGEVQDPYNIRCAAQVLGTCAELIDRARRTLTIEANAVTDNPILLDAGAGFDARWAGRRVDIVSGGHFHGMPIAVDLYGLLQAAAMIARLSNMRCARYVDETRNKGLGADLKWPGPSKDEDWTDRHAVWSGMMIPEYVSAGVTNWILGLAMPSHLFSVSTDAGQEDHVSMAANVGLRVRDALPRLAEVLAVELAFAAQAAALRKAMPAIPSRAPDPDRPGMVLEFFPLSESARRLSPASEAVLGAISSHFPVVREDRVMSGEIRALAEAVIAGDIPRAIRPFDLWGA